MNEPTKNIYVKYNTSGTQENQNNYVLFMNNTTTAEIKQIKENY